MARKGNWTVGRQLGAALALPLVFLLLIGSYAYTTTQRLLVATGAVAHTREVLTTLTDTLSVFQDMETGQRGYVLTGDEAFLQPYREGNKTIDRAIEEVARLTGENEGQRRRVKDLSRLVGQERRTLEAVIDRRNREGLEAAAKLVSTGQGKRTMDAVRGVIDAMMAEERTQLGARTAAVDDLVRAFARGLVGACLFAFVLVGGVGLLLVRSLKERIGAVAHRMRNAARELEAVSAQQASSTATQVTTSEQVSVTIRELTATARQIAMSANQVNRVAEDTAEAAQGGDATMLSARAAVEATRKQVDDVVGHMLGLNKRSQEIGGIVDMIRDLSEQTNILSINATIEAVGAGAAGRRFSVVAGEIRKLADRVSASAQNIQRLIEQVRGATDATATVTEHGAKAVDASTKRFAEVGASFERIRWFVANTAASSREIETSTRHQTTAMEQVSVAMGAVSNAAREVQESATQTRKTASELAMVSEELLRLVRDQGPGRVVMARG